MRKPRSLVRYYNLREKQERRMRIQRRFPGDTPRYSIWSFDQWRCHCDFCRRQRRAYVRTKAKREARREIELSLYEDRW